MLKVLVEILPCHGKWPELTNTASGIPNASVSILSNTYCKVCVLSSSTPPKHLFHTPSPHHPNNVHPPYHLLNPASPNLPFTNPPRPNHPHYPNLHLKLVPRPRARRLPPTNHRLPLQLLPSIEWYDHAFRIRRVGHEAVLGLHKAFNHCNQPFQADIKVSLLIFSLTHPSPFPRRAPVLSRGPLGSHSCNRACLGWPGMTNPVSDNIQCLPASLPKSRL